MKRILIFAVVILITIISAEAPIVYGQVPSATTLKVGYFNPKGSKAGFVFGGNYSWIVDESVDIGIAVDFFRKKYIRTLNFSFRERIYFNFFGF